MCSVRRISTLVKRSFSSTMFSKFFIFALWVFFSQKSNKEICWSSLPSQNILTFLLIRVVQQSDMEGIIWNRSTFKEVCCLPLKNCEHSTDDWTPSFSLVFYKMFFLRLYLIFCLTEKIASGRSSEFIGWLQKLLCLEFGRGYSTNFFLTWLSMKTQGSFKYTSNSKSVKKKSFFFSNTAWFFIFNCQHCT